MRLLLLLGLLGVAIVSEAQSPIVSDFDHDTTGFRLEGAHQIAQCGDCHSRGQFSGTPLNCESCHSTGGRVSASAKPTFHMLTTNQCDQCHTSYAWLPTLTVDHTQVLGTCSSCHDNRVALGKPIDHVPTNADCAVCHRTTLFALATFSHNGIVAGCFQCHNNRIAVGKPPDHIPAPDTCEDCHNTMSFSLTSGATFGRGPLAEYVRANSSAGRGDSP